MGFQAQVCLILRYFYIYCSQPELTFERSWFCVSLEKSPERDALYSLYLLHGKKGGTAACTRVLICAWHQQFQSLGTFKTRMVWCLYYYKSHLNFHTFDSCMLMPTMHWSQCMICTPVMLNGIFSTKWCTFDVCSMFPAAKVGYCSSALSTWMDSLDISACLMWLACTSFQYKVHDWGIQ